MRKRMKKLICILIAATMVTTANSFMPSMNVYAEDSQAGVTNGTYGDNITWTLEDGTLTINGTGELNEIDGNDIPWDKDSVQWLKLGEGITKVGMDFSGYERMERAQLSSTVSDLPETFVDGCPNLKYITVDGNNEKYASFEYGTFGESALYNRDKTKLIRFPEGGNGFGFPDSIKTIGKRAFYNVNTLNSLELPDGIIEIEDEAFENSSIRKIKMSDSIETIGENVFSDCNYLWKVVMPKNLKEIGKNAISFEDIGIVYMTGNAPDINNRGIDDPTDGNGITIVYPDNNATYSDEFKKAFAGSDTKWVAEDVEKMDTELKYTDMLVSIDKQGQTIDSNSDSSESCNISIKTTSSFVNECDVTLYLKSQRDESKIEEHTVLNNRKTDTYEFDISNLYDYEAFYSGKVWIEKVKSEITTNINGEDYVDTTYAVVSDGEDCYKAENPQDAKYWFDVNRTHRMSFYTPNLNIKDYNGSVDIYDPTKRIYVNSDVTKAGMSEIYQPEKIDGLEFKGWYAPYLDAMDDDEKYHCNCVMYPIYDKKIIPFKVNFSEPDDNGNTGEIVYILFSDTYDVTMPVVKGYEGYTWKSAESPADGISYYINVEGKKPNEELQLVSEPVPNPKDDTKTDVKDDTKTDTKPSDDTSKSDTKPSTDTTKPSTDTTKPSDKTNSDTTTSTTATVVKNGLYHEGSDWNYYVDGKFAASTTTLIKYNGTWWYVQNGKINFNETTLVKYNGTWWYVQNGKVNFNASGLCKYNGTWWYVQNGKVNFNTTTLCKYNGSWWYVSSGKINFGATGLCKYNGTWWYVQNGKINFSATTLCKYNGTWWYVQNGKINFGATTLCKYNGTWWYVQNGKINFNATTLCRYNGAWWNIRNGKVNFSTTLCKYNGTWWYIQNGRVNFNAVTLCKYGNNWYAVAGGKVAWGYTGNIKYNGGTFRVVNGIVRF